MRKMVAVGEDEVDFALMMPLVARREAGAERRAAANLPQSPPRFPPGQPQRLTRQIVERVAHGDQAAAQRIGGDEVAVLRVRPQDRNGPCGREDRIEEAGNGNARPILRHDLRRAQLPAQTIAAQSA